jgi:hypothetical protein
MSDLPHIDPQLLSTKPTILYRGDPFIAGTRAYLEKTNRYSDWSEGAITSTVLSFDKSTGRIETLNSIYTPETPL